MFYAQNLKKKLDSDYKPYLKINQDCLFPYKFTKNNSTTLFSRIKSKRSRIYTYAIKRNDK